MNDIVIPPMPTWMVDLQPYLIFAGLTFAVLAGIQLLITMTKRKRHEKKEREANE